jgi:hypothetical protein
MIRIAFALIVSIIERVIFIAHPLEVQQYQNVSAARDKVAIKLEQGQRKLQSLLELQQSVASARANSFPNFYSKLLEKHANAGLTEEQWKDFKIDFSGDVTKTLTTEIEKTTSEVNSIKGISPRKESDPFTEASFIQPHANLETLSFEVLSQEIKRLQYFIGIDNENGRQFTRLSAKIVKEEAEAEKLKREITIAEGAETRIKLMQEKGSWRIKRFLKHLLQRRKN